MRIHTSLTMQEVDDLARSIPQVSVAWIGKHGSRKRDHAVEIRLHGSSSHQTQSNDGNAATWDEWGAFISAVFERDQTAIVGEYWSPEFFRWTTNARFGGWHFDSMSLADQRYVATGIPEDTHPQHHFQFTGETAGGSINVYECSKCSAVLRRIAYGHDLSEVFEADELIVGFK